MRKPRDPDNLNVRRITGQDKVFVWWNYDEGVSGTLTITPETAKRLAMGLEAAALLIEMEKDDE